VTDRVIICGLPASGVAALYRNDRQDIRRFLSTRYGEKYRIFNFCPRFENEYDAEYFDNRVSRFPWPDHHPPPLALIPLCVRRMHEWLSADDENVMVIHCKAGKGRSGTMTCCYLLSLPSLPKAPLLPQNFSKGKKPAQKAANRDNVSRPVSNTGSSSNSSRPDSPHDSSDNEESMSSMPRSQSGGAAYVMVD
jgi:phosphatidylinositol-3,4,5-trisphosphate 3-phosphatase/dual-specificity protein phosphatase PTEN